MINNHFINEEQVCYQMEMYSRTSLYNIRRIKKKSKTDSIIFACSCISSKKTYAPKCEMHFLSMNCDTNTNVKPKKSNGIEAKRAKGTDIKRQNQFSCKFRVHFEMNHYSRVFTCIPGKFLDHNHSSNKSHVKF